MDKNNKPKADFMYVDDIAQAIINLSVAIDNVNWSAGQLRSELDAITIQFLKITGDFNS